MRWTQVSPGVFRVFNVRQSEFQKLHPTAAIAINAWRNELQSQGRRLGVDAQWEDFTLRVGELNAFDGHPERFGPHHLDSDDWYEEQRYTWHNQRAILVSRFRGETIPRSLLPSEQRR